MNSGEFNQRESDSMNYKDIITIEPGKRGGKPCIRGMRITTRHSLPKASLGIVDSRRDRPLAQLSKPVKSGDVDTLSVGKPE